MNAAIYLRVSTEKQDAAVQEPALVKLCAARGWTGAPVYTETESGAKPRPTLDKLCERARRGEYQVIVVWALDRLGRDLWEIIARVRSLWDADVKIVSLQDAWLDGAAGPVRDLLLMLLAWVASFERARLRERTKAGVKAAQVRAAKGLGRAPGRPRVPDEALRRACDLWKGGNMFGSVSLRAACNQVTYTVERRNRKTGAVRTVTLHPSPAAVLLFSKRVRKTG